VFDGVGHFPQSEAPERFVDALRTFMRDTTPAEGTADQLRALLGTRGA